MTFAEALRMKLDEVVEDALVHSRDLLVSLGATPDELEAMLSVNRRDMEAARDKHIADILRADGEPHAPSMSLQ